MNKYKEAFESLTDWFHAYTDDYGVRVLERHITDDYKESKKIIRELVEKSIPMKKELRKSGELMVHYVCPVCHSLVGNVDKYCTNCGQRLDWSDEE